MLKERVSTLTLNKVQQAGNSVQDVCSVLSTATCADLETIGYFLYRVRQARRRFKKHCCSLRDSLKREAFGVRKAAWRTKGQHVCRHGMFFAKGFGSTCDCASANPTWEGVKRMPALDVQRKAIVTKAFDAKIIRRLGQLQADIRRLGW